MDECSLSNWTRFLVGAGVVFLTGILMPVVSYVTVLSALFGLAAAGVLVFHPKLLWLILVLLLPFSVEIPNLLGAGTNVTAPTEALVLLVGIAVPLSVFRVGKLRWTLSPLHAAVGVYLILQWFSLFHTPLPMVTLKALVRTSSYLLCGYILTQIAVRRLDDLRGFFPLMMVSTSGLVVYGFYTQFIEGVSVYQNIAHPFFQNHCIYAAWLCFPLAFAMAALTQKIPNRGWIAMFLGLVGLAVLLSFVRGSWLGIIGLIGYLGYRHRSILNIRFVLLLSVLVITGVAIVFFLGLGQLFQDRWVNLFDRRYVTNDSRIDRWMAALSMWKSYPLFGAGLGCYPDLYPQFIYYLDAFERNIRMGAHSVFFEILAELGVTGFAAYLWVVGCFFRETRRMARLAGKDPQRLALALGLESMMVVYLIHGVVNNLGPSDKIDVAFWTTCGLAVSLRCWFEKEKSNLTGGDGF